MSDDKTLAIIAALVAGDRWLSADSHAFTTISLTPWNCARSLAFSPSGN